MSGIVDMVGFLDAHACGYVLYRPVLVAFTLAWLFDLGIVSIELQLAFDILKCCLCYI
jgi:hypothetical protein